jgi:hypothetical protein
MTPERTAQHDELNRSKDAGLHATMTADGSAERKMVVAELRRRRTSANNDTRSFPLTSRCSGVAP